MSKMAELDYDIQELYIEGYSPKTIARMLECPLEMVHAWLDMNSIVDEKIDEDEWDVAFPPHAEDYYGA
jgi:uncharacterized protein YjcR